MSKTTYALAALNHGSIKGVKVINLRFTTNGKPRYKTLKVNVQSKNWDQKTQRVKGGQRGEPNADIINEKIQKILLEARTKGNTNIGEKENSFVSYAKHIIDGTHTTGTKSNRVRAIKKLEKYLNHRGLNDLPFHKLDNIFIEGYYSWLMKEGGLKVSTANEYMQILSQVIDKTIQSGKYQFRVHPFINYQRKRTDNLLVVLDDDDLNKLAYYEPKSKKQKMALKIFWFMMHLSGIRIGDALKLTFNNFYVDDKDRLMVKYHSQKGGKVVTTKVSIDAALEMVSFLKDYSQEKNIANLTRTMEEYLEMKDQIRDHEVEKSHIFPTTLNYLMRYFDDQKDPSIQRRFLEEEVKKENRKDYLHHQINYLNLKLNDISDKLFRIIKKIIMELKRTHPTDTVIPLMRGVHMGEYKMSDEVEEIWNAHKVKNNHALKRIAKKVGIKKKISNHQARHVFAMKLFLKGVNLHHISLALGHADISTTDKYRQKLVDDTVHEVTDDFSESFRDLIRWSN
ncbi:tyrosine-type recombinase/integrase [Salinimicrobium sp. CDJ15-81-2]|nr:tyrosine-type recombinase/integrase [Salinimicrobium nanhaiense]